MHRKRPCEGSPIAFMPMVIVSVDLLLTTKTSESRLIVKVLVSISPVT